MINMDRAEKIMTALLIVALIAVLLHAHRSRGHRSNLTGLDLNTSTLPDNSRRGPTYLLSALPDHRNVNDAIQDVGCWPYSGYDRGDDYAES